MWFALRVTYGRELKFQKLLKEACFETFVPMKKKKFEKGGKEVVKIVPAVSNLCFVNGEKGEIDTFLQQQGPDCFARYMWDKATGKPAVVPETAMASFIKVCSVMADDILYIKEISPKLQAGTKVKVLDGPFKGVEGTVARIKKSRRVIVELPGMLAVATTYVQPQHLELV
ncbi:MAG: UpxY family transcription antiterminator [Bacteroidales bacterium]|nr:UpxY family transcription antiterminator [Bacteroidales bacterium]